MNYFRRKRFAQFIEYLNADENSTIIDFGGLPYDWVDVGFKGKVLCVSLSNIREGKWGTGNIQYRKMNLLDNNFQDKEFDICYSNSLLEHVGKKNQKDIANEIIRVSKKFWVQIPYRYFLLEPHYRFPFFHAFPQTVKHFIAKNWTPLFMKENYYLNEVDSIYLPTYSEYKTLFDEGEIIKEKFLGLTKSLIAIQR